MAPLLAIMQAHLDGTPLSGVVPDSRLAEVATDALSNVAQALRGRNDTAALDLALSCRLHGSKLDLRAVGALLLRNLGDVRAITPLLGALASESTDKLRPYDFEGLWGIARALEVADDAQAMETLLTGLSAQDRQKWMSICARLDGQGEEQREFMASNLYAAPIHPAADNEWPRNAAQQEATQALRRWERENAVELLIAALRDESKFVRREAAQALGRLRDRSAIEPAIAALNSAMGDDSDVFTRWRAEEALVALGGMNGKSK